MESHWFPYSSWSSPPFKVYPFLSVTSLKPGSAPSWLMEACQSCSSPPDSTGADLRNSSQHLVGLLRLQSKTSRLDDTQAVWQTPLLVISLIIPILKEKVGAHTHLKRTHDFLLRSRSLRHQTLPAEKTTSWDSFSSSSCGLDPASKLAFQNINYVQTS